MIRLILRRITRTTWLGGLAAVGFGCSDPGSPVPLGPSLAAGGKGGGITVTATDPPYGNQGETGKRVTVIGSGFLPGDQASWQRNGTPDPKISVLSTDYVSSTQLLATINIAPDAEVTFYDIAVTSPGRKGGIGTELFEVTQAIPIEGTSILRGVNESGEFGGSSYIGQSDPAAALYWSVSTGLVYLPPSDPDGGGIWSIDEAGQTMSGYKFKDGATPVWTLVGGQWQYGRLPGDPSALHGNGRAIASDPVTGVAVYIAGQENYKGKGNSHIYRPRLWRRGAGGWERVVLPSLAPDGTGVVQDVNPPGVAVGSSNGRAVIWEPDGAGGWTIAYLPGSEFDARAINSAGDLIGGGTNAYWRREPSGGWTLNFLPIACSAVMAVDDLGRIGADNCDRPSTGSGTGGPRAAVAPAVFSPPYTDPPVYLGSLGAKSSAANLEKMSLRGSWIAGQVGGGGVYWRIF